jgi:hypothetical protein
VTLVNRFSLIFLLALASWKDNVKAMVEERKVQFDAWLSYY